MGRIDRKGGGREIGGCFGGGGIFCGKKGGRRRFEHGGPVLTLTLPPLSFYHACLILLPRHPFLNLVRFL